MPGYFQIPLKGLQKIDLMIKKIMYLLLEEQNITLCTYTLISITARYFQNIIIVSMLEIDFHPYLLYGFSYLFIHVYMYMYICIHIFCTYTYICIYVHIYICTYIRTYIHVRICIYCTYIYIHIHVYTYIYKSMCIYIYPLSGR